jgi:hypothetical protein
MIKKQQKWIALLVTLTFMWLLQVSTMPLAAANTTEQVSSANSEQAPDFFEAVGHNASLAKKKSIVPIVLIGVGVVAVAAVLFLVVLKTKYDPVGTWSGPVTSQTTNWTGQVTFSGDKKSGTIIYSNYYSGTYTVSGKDITYNYIYNDQTITFTGKFDSKDTMSGTWINVPNSYLNGTWQLTRGTSATQFLVPLNHAGTKGAIKDN